MKHLLILLLSIYCCHALAQTCGCNSKPELKSKLPCDTLLLDVQSRLFRQYNCDSSWLMYNNNTGTQRVLYSIKTDLLKSNGIDGYQFVGSFKKTFLVRNKITADRPPEYILFSKTDGLAIKKFGAILYFTGGAGGAVVYFDHKSHDFINVYSIDTGKDQKVILPKGRLDYTMKTTGDIYPESLIELVQIKGKIVTVNYKYLKTGTKNAWLSTVATLTMK